MHQTLYYWYQIWQLQLWRQRLGFNSLTQSQVQTYSTAYNPNKLPEGKMLRSSSESSFVSADILEEATSHLSIASLASQQAAATHGGPRTMVQNPRGWKTPLGSSHPTYDWSPPCHPNQSTGCHIQVCTRGKTGSEQILSRGPNALRSLTVTPQFEFLSAKLACFNHQPNSTRALSSRAMRWHRVRSQHTAPLCRISLNQAPLCT